MHARGNITMIDACIHLATIDDLHMQFFIIVEYEKVTRKANLLNTAQV